jgi:hypothetical protein
MKIHTLMSFAPSGRDRETLPCFPVSIIGRAIECSDQSGTMRLLPGDRVRIDEIRMNYVLASHTSLKGGVLLIAADQLLPIPAPETQPEEDAAL